MYPADKKLAIDKEVIEVSSALDGWISEPSNVAAMGRKVRKFNIVQFKPRKNYVPVLAMPHKQWEGSVCERQEQRNMVKTKSRECGK